MAGKHVREGVHFAVGEREVMGCDLRAAELHERHGEPSKKKFETKTHACKLLLQREKKKASETHVHAHTHTHMYAQRERTRQRQRERERERICVVVFCFKEKSKF